MLKFPIFERLSVRDYLLYPGRQNSAGLSLSFTRGPWIILGVNGLGKSTLLLLLKHILTGPVTVRPPGFAGERSDLVNIDRRLFARRVGDGAQSAEATLTVRFGETTLRIQRRLGDLSLLEVTSTTGDGQRFTDEAQYQALLSRVMGLARFDDAIRVLDRVTFFLEDRTPLIWDVSAQFELFRAILTPDISQNLRQLEADIVSNDSAARNLNAALFKLIKNRDSELAKQKGSTDTQARLAKISAELEIALQKEVTLQSDFDRSDERRADARIELKRAERAVANALEAYEQAKLDALRHSFAGLPPNEQYVFVKLMVDRICPACGSSAEAAAKDLEQRKDEDRCLICGSPRHRSRQVPPTTSASRARATASFESLQKARNDLENARKRFEDASTQRSALSDELENVRLTIETTERETRRLRAKLPSGDQTALARDENRIAALRREVHNFRRDRDEAERKIESLLDVLKTATETIRGTIENNFQKRVKVFFAGNVRLVYAARKDRIGQGGGGRQFEFPAFEVEMLGTASEGEFIRRAADQVSLSQREYLDAIFRMSLLESFGAAGCSFVIDGPEGSLDAVFSERAGALFGTFANRRPASNVILACNVVEGGFIPNTLRAFHSYATRSSRVVNLLSLASPTAALGQLRPEYNRKVVSILKQGAR